MLCSEKIHIFPPTWTVRESYCILMKDYRNKQTNKLHGWITHNKTSDIQIWFHVALNVFNTNPLFVALSPFLFCACQHSFPPSKSNCLIIHTGERNRIPSRFARLSMIIIVQGMWLWSSAFIQRSLRLWSLHHDINRVWPLGLTGASRGNPRWQASCSEPQLARFELPCCIAQQPSCLRYTVRSCAVAISAHRLQPSWVIHINEHRSIWSTRLLDFTYGEGRNWSTCCFSPPANRK